MPGSPAGGRDRACLPLDLVVRYRACLPLDLVVRCSSAGGAEFRVLASWGPLLVPGSLYSPATEILSFFLGSFEVVDEGFLPPTAGRSFIGGTSPCSGMLLRVTAFSGLRAGDCGLPLWRRVHARVWMVACLSLRQEWRTATSRVATLDALCIDRNLFPVNPGLFWTFFCVGFRRACASLLLPCPLGACRSLLHLFTG